MMNKIKNEQTLIFGATGFIGSQLVKQLIANRKHIITIVRSPEKVKFKSKYLTIVKGDLLNTKSYKQQLESVETIYYLVHAMGEDGNFESIEQKQARELALNLKKKHKIIYLSGLGSPESEHIRSRHNVGQIFKQSQAISVELRASIVLGAGSLSFEMIHGIARRFPFSIKTSWSEAKCEPVALEDVVFALNRLSQIKYKSGIYEIGCGEVVPYSDLIIRAAKIKNKDMIKVPIAAIPKTLVLEVMRFMLPEYYQAGQYLMGSIEIPTYVRNQNILELMGRKPIALDTALKTAVANSESLISDDFTWQDKVAEIVDTLPEKHKSKIRLFFRGLKLLRKNI